LFKYKTNRKENYPLVGRREIKSQNSKFKRRECKMENGKKVDELTG